MKKIKFDYNKLKGRIKEKNLTLNEFANKVNIGRTALYSKLERNGEFTESEMFRICNVLEIPLNEVSVYFFTKYVR
ncbi:helix-turn-helix domain-containing protein [Gemella massiliensis]|uniref:helix-turn-helix domain-containing protein n=1 Tax=Gemella massiliensis TaxID=1909670 RepID=UPI000931D39C|nr:helix-turn-helix transcriptional regulator [Gemella massiliensis]